MEDTVICPECGNLLIRQEGCLRCCYCGWSECDCFKAEQEITVDDFRIATPFYYLDKVRKQM